MRMMTAHKDARYATRLDVQLSAQLRQHGSAFKFMVDIIDLSRSGFRCRTAHTLKPGQILSLALPGLAPLSARVAWERDYVYGCAFDGGLHVAVFDHIIAMYRPARLPPTASVDNVAARDTDR